jgi:hypothetical protein
MPRRSKAEALPMATRYEAAVAVDRAAMKLRDELRSGRPSPRRIAMLKHRIRDQLGRI